MDRQLKFCEDRTNGLGVIALFMFLDNAAWRPKNELDRADFQKRRASCHRPSLCKILGENLQAFFSLQCLRRILRQTDGQSAGRKHDYNTPHGWGVKRAMDTGHNKTIWHTCISCSWLRASCTFDCRILYLRTEMIGKNTPGWLCVSWGNLP